MKFKIFVFGIVFVVATEICLLLMPLFFEEEADTIKTHCQALNFEIWGISVRLQRFDHILNNFQDKIITGDGLATYYHPRFEGKTMKYGKIYCPDSNSVACNFLPAETVVYFRNKKNGKVAVGIVRDTGNLFGRQFDLSEKLMSDLNGIKDGVIEVQWLAVVK